MSISRSMRVSHNQIAVSANQAETALNIFQTLDTALIVAASAIADLEHRRESNKDEIRGKEEADRIYDLGRTSKLDLEFDKAMPQHFAFALSYGLGAVTTSAAGTGYTHTIRPIDGDLDADRSVPTFTVGQRFGKTVLKRRFASLAVDSVTATFAADDWVKLKASCKGTGKHESSYTEETVSAAANSTSLTLAANGVAGATADERLASIHRIRAELTSGVWTEVTATAVDSATPAEIDITAPGSGTSLINYKILYAPVESAWMAFPTRVEESPLRVSQTTLVVGGTWNGTAFQGGREVAADFKSFEYSLNNNLKVEFLVGAAGDFASRIWRDERSQTIKLSRDLRDMVMQQYLAANEYFGLHLTATGAEYESGRNYKVEFIFPRLAVLSAPISVDGKKLAEAGDLTVLEDDTYGSVIVRVTNLVAHYAA